MREQALEGKVDEYAGEELHLAISLARGLDGQPRNFRQVFTVLQALHESDNLQSGMDSQAAAEKANNAAWAETVRVFRGTDCQTPGVCYTKDIAYCEGNIAVWGVIGDNPDSLLLFNLGKFDPANERHLLVLSQLGLTDGDLQDLNIEENA